MEKDNLEDVFKNLKGTFDTEEPTTGHQERFLEKLNKANKVVTIHKKRRNWWRPLSIAASIAILCLVGVGINNSNQTVNEHVAQISPEIGNTQVYFTSLIEDQVKNLENESSPETQKIISDTMIQLKKLETNYSQLEKDLINGGNDKLLLSAMITNFQIRIDLLQYVINQIETIKSLKNNSNENYTI